MSSDNACDNYDPEYKPIIELQKTSVLTGEEDEKELVSIEGKLYRWGMGNEGLQWKMRATGNVRLLKNNKDDRVRVVMREGHTQKVRLNHFIKDVNIRFREKSDKHLLWESIDYCKPDNIDEPKEGTEIHQFAIRFRNSESANEFKNVWDSCQTKKESCSVKEQLEILHLPSNFYENEETKIEEKVIEEKVIEEKFEDIIISRLDKLERMIAKMSRTMAKMNCAIEWLMKNELN